MWALWLAHRYRWYRYGYNIPGSWFALYRAQAVAQLRLKPGCRVLIIGAGTGLDLDALPCFADITLVDTEPTVLKMAQKRAMHQGKNVTLCVADARNLPFEPHSFDAVIANLCLTVMYQPAEVGVALSRVVKPAGYLSVLDLFEPLQKSAWDRIWQVLYPIGNVALGAMHYQLSDILNMRFWQVKAMQRVALFGRYQWWLLQAPALNPES